jgi:hypothetical protein
MPISLQGTVAFEPEFVGNLTMLTRTMIVHGLDPDCIEIAKDIASAPTLPFVGPFCYDYAVTAGDDRFTITASGDTDFLDDFLRRITDHDDGAAHVARDGVFFRLTRWMSPQT